jgi:hypothetical protein
MRNRIFHQARIGDLTFDSVISGDGPYLSRQLNGEVALGVSGLRHFQPEIDCLKTSFWEDRKG